MQETSAHAGRQDFFLLLRKLQQFWNNDPKIGYAVTPQREPIRFKQDPSLGFSATLIESFEPDEQGKAAVLNLNYHGVWGVNGPIPLDITEYALNRINHDRDHTLRNFVNIFHHRIISFLFRAWADCNIVADMDRLLSKKNENTTYTDVGDEGKFFDFIGSFSGMGMEGMRNMSKIPDFAQLYYSGWLSRRVRSKEGLEKILSDFFEVPVKVLPFQGSWQPLPRDYQTELGDSERTGILGNNFVLGDHFWDCSLNFRVQIGPISFREFERLLPGSDSFERLCSWVKIYAGKSLFWDVELLVSSREVSVLRLGRAGKLGLNTWLQTPLKETVEHIIFLPRKS